jgi:hypothetical protein
MMNALAGSPGMQILERALETAILEEFRQIDQLGGILAATELRYQRSQIQAAAYRYERQVNDGVRPIIGWNRYGDRNATVPDVKVVRTPHSKQQRQIARLKRFKHQHRAQAPRALERLSKVVERGGNVFAELLHTVDHGAVAGPRRPLPSNRLMKHWKRIRLANQLGVEVQKIIHTPLRFRFIDGFGHQEVGGVVVAFGLDQAVVECRQLRINCL